MTGVFLELVDILLKFQFVCGVDVPGVKKSPSVELFHVLSFDLRKRRILEPFRQVPLRVWNVLDTAFEECFALRLRVGRGMNGGTLEKPFSGKIE
jgi:hypothetical protein